MKKYLKLSFDSVSYYEFTDKSETIVRKVTLNEGDIDKRFMNVYFEYDNKRELYTELGSKKMFSVPNVSNFKGERVDLGYALFGNTTIRETSDYEVLMDLRRLNKDSMVRDYSTFMSKLFISSSKCFKLMKDSEVIVDRKSLKSKKTNTNNDFSYGNIRKYELEKQNILLRKCKEKGIN